MGPFLQTEHVFFFRIDPNGNDQFVKQGDAPVDDVIMAQGKGVERSRKDGTSHSDRGCTVCYKDTYFSRKASIMAISNSSGRDMPAALACCGKILSSVRPGEVFISSI